MPRHRIINQRQLLILTNDSAWNNEECPIIDGSVHAGDLNTQLWDHLWHWGGGAMVVYPQCINVTEYCDGRTVVLRGKKRENKLYKASERPFFSTFRWQCNFLVDNDNKNKSQKISIKPFSVLFFIILWWRLDAEIHLINPHNDAVTWSFLESWKCSYSHIFW